MGWTSRRSGPTFPLVTRLARFTLVGPWVAVSGVALAATLTVDVTHRGLPLDTPEHGRVYVRAQPGEDAPDELQVAWGLSGVPIRVEDGTYDVVVKYVNDRVEHVELLEDLPIRGAVRRTVDFTGPIARLTLSVTLAGQPIPRFEGSYRVYRAGQRGTPLAAKRPGDTLTILPGTYDIEVAWRGPNGLERTWLTDYPLRDVHVETFDVAGGRLAEGRLPDAASGDGLSSEQ
jgi:hypothetical protein